MEQEMNQDLFSDLPSHITIDIFSRLSTKTIGRCCCVCRQWQALAHSPEHGHSRQTRTRPTLMVHTISSHPPLLTAVELEDEPTSHGMYYLHGAPLTDLTEGLTPNNNSMLSSTNGLLCFYEFGYHNPDRILVLNPVTMESITLPTTGGAMEYPNVTSYGFGSTSASSDALKVVKIYQEKDADLRITKSECYVYTLGQGCWRVLQKPAPFEYSCRSHGVFFNGYIHWVITDQNITETLSSFDLEKESFRAIPAPPGYDQRGLSTLGVYKGGFLCLCDNTSDYETTVWVMEEYGVKESWVKKFVIDKEAWGISGESYEVVSVLRVFEDGTVLLQWGDVSLYSYNSETHYLEKLDIQNLARLSEEYPSIVVADYVPSFVSLKRFGREIVQLGPIVRNA